MTAGVVIAAVVCAAGDPARANDPNQVIAAAEHAAQHGEIAKALSQLRTAQAQTPSPGLFTAELNLLVASERYAEALQRFAALSAWTDRAPRMHLAAARAYAATGCDLGDARLQRFAEGQVGQLRGQWLLVEARGDERFLACPPASALYQARAALEANVTTADARLLYAQIWRRLGKLDTAAALLDDLMPSLLQSTQADLLDEAIALARDVGDRRGLLRLARRRAQLAGADADAVLRAAYADAAALSRQAGEPRVCAELLRRAHRLAPQDTALLLRLGDAEWDADQPARAVHHYRRLLTLEPNHPQQARLRVRLSHYFDDASE